MSCKCYTIDNLWQTKIYMHNIQESKKLEYNLVNQLVHILLLLLFFNMVRQTLSITCRQVDAYDLIGLILWIKLQLGNEFIIIIDNGMDTIDPPTIENDLTRSIATCNSKHQLVYVLLIICAT